MKESLLTDIYIVEDDEVFLKSLTHHLHQIKRYKITPLTSGEACIKKLHLKPDIIILDLNLTGLSGLETLKKIKLENPETYVIICSEQDDMQTTLDVLKAGAYEYIIKNENSATRVKNCINNIIKNEEVKSENLDLKLRVNKYKLFLTIFIFIVLFFIFLTLYLQFKG